MSAPRLPCTYAPVRLPPCRTCNSIRGDPLRACLSPYYFKRPKRDLLGFCAIFSRPRTINLPPSWCYHPTTRHMPTTLARQPGCKLDLCAAVLMPHAEWHQTSKLSLKVTNLFLTLCLCPSASRIRSFPDSKKKQKQIGLDDAL
jgi:hypothetical protein